jgi:hypothetical protein
METRLYFVAINELVLKTGAICGLSDCVGVGKVPLLRVLLSQNHGSLLYLASMGVDLSGSSSHFEGTRLTFIYHSRASADCV